MQNDFEQKVIAESPQGHEIEADYDAQLQHHYELYQALGDTDSPEANAERERLAQIMHEIQVNIDKKNDKFEDRHLIEWDMDY